MSDCVPAIAVDEARKTCECLLLELQEAEKKFLSELEEFLRSPGQGEGESGPLFDCYYRECVIYVAVVKDAQVNCKGDVDELDWFIRLRWNRSDKKPGGGHAFEFLEVLSNPEYRCMVRGPLMRSEIGWRWFRLKERLDRGLLEPIEELSVHALLEEERHKYERRVKAIFGLQSKGASDTAKKWIEVRRAHADAVREYKRELWFESTEAAHKKDILHKESKLNGGKHD